jgi:Uma2 family endonuclease
MVSTRRNSPTGRDREQVNPALPTETLPTMYDLPSEDPEEPGLPDEFHDLQPHLLSRTLQLSGYSPDNYFSVSDLNIYYDVNHPRWHKRPDWFLAVNVPRLYEQRDLRMSYVIWQEQKPPAVVVEFLSPGTEKGDLGRFYTKASRVTDEEVEEVVLEIEPLGENNEPPPRKLEAYERYLKVPHYVVYSRHKQQLRYFKLEGRYEEQVLNSENPLIWLADLEIGLGIWQGEFEGRTATWLRWCDCDGNWHLTDTEQAEQQVRRERRAKERERRGKERERRGKEQEQQAREQAQAQVLQAARNLLATGMPLEQVTQVLQLSEAQLTALV